MTEIGTCDACMYENVAITQHMSTDRNPYLLCAVCAGTFIGTAVMTAHGGAAQSAEVLQTIGYATNMILARFVELEQRLERIEAAQRPRL